MAGVLAIATAVSVTACGTGGQSNGISTASPSMPVAPSASASGGPSDTSTPLVPAVTAIPGQRCGDSPGNLSEPTYALPHVTIPLGSDACQEIGPFGSPKVLAITNDGPRVAFNAWDYDHENDLWYGDLTAKSIKIVYRARQTSSEAAEVLSPQLVGLQLVWLERIHATGDIHSPVKTWAVKIIDVASNQVRTLLEESSGTRGGSKTVDEIRFDGQRIALMESLAGGGSQIEMANLTGHVTAKISVTGEVFDLGLVSDGLLYSTGTPAGTSGALKDTRLWHWTGLAGSREIGQNAFQINTSGDLASWVADPIASAEGAGYFQAPRVYAAMKPFAGGEAISPIDSESGTKGIDGAAAGSGTIAWWEEEARGDAAQGVLTLWQPGWNSAIQVDTEGAESYRVSLGGDWLVWSEEFGRDVSPLLIRIRGIPIATLGQERTSS